MSWLDELVVVYATSGNISSLWGKMNRSFDEDSILKLLFLTHFLGCLTVYKD